MAILTADLESQGCPTLENDFLIFHFIVLWKFTYMSFGGFYLLWIGNPDCVLKMEAANFLLTDLSGNRYGKKCWLKEQTRRNGEKIMKKIIKIDDARLF